MDKIIEDILNRLRNGNTINADKLNSIIRHHNKGLTGQTRHHAKKYLLPYYLKNKQENTDVYKNWNITKSDEDNLHALLKMKPMRSASGVATITVITKPQKCGGNCIFCPNDIRMPKSYLSNEPACQRAERNFFDPYLQVYTRLKALHEMGHNTDKVEMIVLGGTWNDYSINYQRWFICGLFEALNDGLNFPEKFNERESLYKNAGISNDIDKLRMGAQDIQNQINKQKLNYNQAFDIFYNEDSPWSIISKCQKSSWDDVYQQQKINETAKHRCVGLVVETRPAVINDETLTTMRKLGCTKIQIGVQSLDETKMSASNRATEREIVANAFAQLRLYGFKIHAHFMANLPMSNPHNDKKDFKTLVADSAYLPDEIKLYPCMLVESARLNKLAEKGQWKAYDERTLVDVLVDDVINTPQYTRISRMMRDISSTDITQGVKKTNLRQMVEQQAEKQAEKLDIEINEIRHREINLSKTNVTNFELKDFTYETNISTEHFLQYVTPENKILGFCRLSLPKIKAFKQYQNLPINKNEAMIREVHVYGKVANIGDSASNAQHLGLGTKLLEKASEIAKEQGYKKLNVISAIGTRQYYKKREFTAYSKNKLYQQKQL